jgi:hypothetical protein
MLMRACFPFLSRFSYLANVCFKPPGQVAVGEIVLCPEGAGATRFVRLRLTEALGS